MPAATAKQPERAAAVGVHPRDRLERRREVRRRQRQHQPFDDRHEAEAEQQIAGQFCSALVLWAGEAGAPAVAGASAAGGSGEWR